MAFAWLSGVCFGLGVHQADDRTQHAEYGACIVFAALAVLCLMWSAR